MGIQAIDLGFLYTKAIINGKRIKLKSVIGDGKKQKFEDLDMHRNKENGDNIRVIVKRDTYFVSDLAINQSDIIRHSLKGDRFSSEDTNILLQALFGMGKLNGQGEIIISGLPVSHYARYKDDIRKLFLFNNAKTHNYDVIINGEPISGQAKFVDGRFIPQPFGVLLDAVLNDDGKIADKVLANKTIAVIDIGFGTTDVFVAEALTPIEKMSFSITTAMNDAYKKIGETIEDEFGMSYQLHSLERIALEGSFKNKGQYYSLDSAINFAYKNLAENIISEITNRWGSSIYDIDLILLAGGGSIALSFWLQSEFPNSKQARDPQWAVVNGYRKWGIKQFVDSEKRSS